MPGFAALGQLKHPHTVSVHDGLDPPFAINLELKMMGKSCAGVRRCLSNFSNLNLVVPAAASGVSGHIAFKNDRLR